MDGVLCDCCLSCVSAQPMVSIGAHHSPTDPVLAASVVKGVFAEVSHMRSGLESEADQ